MNIISSDYTHILSVHSLKILYAVSLFSGFMNSVQRGVWKPDGAPTIYRMIEGLCGATTGVDVVLCPKSDLPGFKSPKRIRLIGLNCDTWVLPFYGNKLLSKVGMGRVYNEVRQAFFLLKLYRLKKPEICYFNNGNLLIAALFATLRLGRVVLRIMGAYPWMKRIAEKRNSLGAWIEYLAYAAPYSCAICSQDGSGGEWFMDSVLRKSVARVMLLNGVDASEGADPLTVKSRLGVDPLKPLILFIGKMESAKGCLEYLEAVKALAEERPESFSAVMIGKGPLLETVATRANKMSPGDKVKVIPSVPHREVIDWYRASDIYVSMNKLGGLSNANLEAMRAGACVVMLSSDRLNHVDEVTDKIIDDECVVRIVREDMVSNLKSALESLLDEPERRRRMGAKMAMRAQEIIPTWQDRIRSELQLLENIAAGTDPARCRSSST